MFLSDCKHLQSAVGWHWTNVAGVLIIAPAAKTEETKTEEIKANFANILKKSWMRRWGLKKDLIEFKDVVSKFEIILVLNTN